MKLFVFAFYLAFSNFLFAFLQDNSKKLLVAMATAESLSVAIFFSFLPPNLSSMMLTKVFIYKHYNHSIIYFDLL